MNARVSVALTILIAASGLVFAQQYRWVDEKGRVQYSDTPPPATAKEARKRGVGSPPVKSDNQQVPYELQKAQAEFPVTLYTAPICKQLCAQAREVLNKRGVPFKEVQVWNVETLAQLKAVAPSDNVPALVVGRSVQTGFDPARFDSLLDQAGYPKAGVLAAGAQAAPALPEGYEPPLVAEPVAPAPEAPAKKAGRYDPSSLPSNRSGKPGPYGVPGADGK